MAKGRDRGRAGKLDRERMRKTKRQVQEAQIEAMIGGFVPIVRKRIERPIEALNETQGQLIAATLSRDIVFATGPAGTGKTYVLAALAAEALERGDIDKLTITRPMRACDENMGALPGEMDEKYAPWVAPVMEVLEERLGKSYVEALIRSGRIEWVPLQFMRGKSLKRTWAILDEAQNTTPGQMKMFLTRIGEGSKLIITGDVNQSDLRDHRGVMQLSGLKDALSRLRALPRVGIIEFTRDDIVRHDLVSLILERYEG